MWIAVWKQHHIACLQRQQFIAWSIDGDATFDDHVKIRPAGGRPVVAGRPTSAEEAEIIQFGPHTQNGCKATQSILAFHRPPASHSDPLGRRSAPRRYR